jgi:hypothetical protein
MNNKKKVEGKIEDIRTMPVSRTTLTSAKEWSPLKPGKSEEVDSIQCLQKGMEQNALILAWQDACQISDPQKCKIMIL